MDEICVTVAGSADSGKSSFIGVMSDGELDNGNGSARNKIARHQHEIVSKKTSDITTKHVVEGKNNVMLVDLCGQDKYLKTTLYGITAYRPDYGILTVAANKGLVKMTKEHMGILLFMNIPFIILITRADLVIDKPDSYNEVCVSIRKILSRYKKRLTFINNIEDCISDDKDKEERTKNTIDKLAFRMVKNKDIPIFTISNTKGYYLDSVRYLLGTLPPRDLWKKCENSIFYIDSFFNPKGIGFVVSGILKGETINVKDEVLIGPIGTNMVPCKIWSIHDNNSNQIESLSNKKRGCFAIRAVDKKINLLEARRRGMVIVSKKSNLDNLAYLFKAKIKILNHSTHITSKYSPVLHCGNIRQSAQINIPEEKDVKMGEELEVNFRFCYHPEFIEPGSLFFFREGTTKGVGNVIEVTPISMDPYPKPAFIVKRKRIIHDNATI